MSMVGRKKVGSAGPSDALTTSAFSHDDAEELLSEIYDELSSLVKKVNIGDTGKSDIAEEASKLHKKSEVTKDTVSKMAYKYNFADYSKIIAMAKANKDLYDYIVQSVYLPDILQSIMDKPQQEEQKSESPSTVVSEVFKFGKVLRDSRKAAGLTQEELAERAGLTRSNVSQLETGSWDPKLSTFLKLANALDKDPADLLPKRQSRQR